MTECIEALKASQYHDEELEESQRTAFEDHLGNCAECQVALREYQSLSDILHGDDTALFTSDVERRVFMRNLHERFDSAPSLSRERFAYPLFAAAAVLFFCTLSSSWLVLQTPRGLDTMAVRWVEYMISEPTVADPEQEIALDEETNLTEWMLYALSEDYQND